MPIIPLAQEEEFTIIIPGEVEEDDPIVVKFRQATEGDNRAREKELQGKWWQEIDDNTNVRRVAVEAALSRNRAAVEMYLTMSYCNIQVPVLKKGEPVLDEDGVPKTKPLFTFTNKNGVHRVTDRSLRDFMAKLDRIPSPWVDKMHEKCLEVNPYWSPFFTGGKKQDEADAAVMSPGE